MRTADGAIQLYNSDGSAAEISGNGTRCAAALLLVKARVRGGRGPDPNRRGPESTCACLKRAGLSSSSR